VKRGEGAQRMNDPIMRIAAIFCCVGMGVGPVVLRHGCCCAMAAQIAEEFDEEQCSECCCHKKSSPVPDPSKCDCPAVSKSFVAVPSSAIKNFADDLSAVEAVFASPFQTSLPGDSSLWEVVENLRPPRVPRHVLFCAFLE
jgi:hypothetical protein